MRSHPVQAIYQIVYGHNSHANLIRDERDESNLKEENSLRTKIEGYTNTVTIFSNKYFR